MTLILLAAMTACPAVTLHQGHPVPLVTATDLSSKTSVKGEMIKLTTAADVIVDDVVAIPAGTDVAGQITDARATGGLGVSGRLAIRPLYLRSGRTIVRLSGATNDKAGVSAGGVIGLALVPAISGRSAAIPAGTRLSATVERQVTIQPVCASPAP